MTNKKMNNLRVCPSFKISAIWPKVTHGQQHVKQPAIVKNPKFINNYSRFSKIKKIIRGKK